MRVRAQSRTVVLSSSASLRRPGAAAALQARALAHLARRCCAGARFVKTSTVGSLDNNLEGLLD